MEELRGSIRGSHHLKKTGAYIGRNVVNIAMKDDGPNNVNNVDIIHRGKNSFIRFSRVFTC